MIIQLATTQYLSPAVGAALDVGVGVDVDGIIDDDGFCEMFGGHYYYYVINDGSCSSLPHFLLPLISRTRTRGHTISNTTATPCYSLPTTELDRWLEAGNLPHNHDRPNGRRQACSGRGG